MVTAVVPADGVLLVLSLYRNSELVCLSFLLACYIFANLCVEQCRRVLRLRCHRLTQQ